MQIPGGYLAHKYGAKHLLVAGLTINGLVALLLPILANVVIIREEWILGSDLNVFPLTYREDGWLYAHAGPSKAWLKALFYRVFTLS
jgi:hypothetical protein